MSVWCGSGASSYAVLLVEIADTTLAYDLSTKRVLYARNAVAEYWLANLVQDVLEVYRNPQGSDYFEHRILRKGETLVPNGAVRVLVVAEVLP